MAIGTTAAIALGGGALLGGIAGAQGSSSTNTTRRILGPAGRGEQLGGEIAEGQLEQLRGLVGQGPGSQDVAAGVDAQRQFAQDIAALRDRGGVPTDAQFEQAGELVEPQRVALEQRLEDERRRVSRIAGRTGRTQDDPILQAKLAQTSARGQERLSAQQSQAAQQLPFQQLQLSQQLANVRQGLASQALQNRQTLFNLGSSLQQQGRQFRLGGATTESTQESGGGLQGAITGAIGGASAAGNIMGSFNAMQGTQQAATQGVSVANSGINFASPTSGGQLPATGGQRGLFETFRTA